jgi:hypothetical protein
VRDRWISNCSAISWREQVKQYIKIIQKGGRNGGMGQLLLTGIGKE